MKKTLLCLGIVFISIVITACSRTPMNGDIENANNPEVVTPVTVSTSKEINVAESFFTIGQIVPRETYVLTPPAAGRVERVLVRNGDRVQKGQTLYVLDQKTLSNNLIQTESALRTAIELLSQQLLELEDQKARMQTLYNQGAVPIVELERLDNQISRLLLQIKDAETNYQKQTQNLQEALNDRIIVSPGRGIVSGLEFNAGEIIGPQNTFRIVDNLDIEIRTSLTASQMRLISGLEKAEVRIEGDANRRINARINQRDTMQNPQNGLYDIILNLQSTEDQLFEGEYVEVVFTVGERAATFIPLKAVKRIGTNTYLFKAEDGRAVRVPVLIGQIYEEWVEVSGDLPKANWIVQGVDSIQDQSLIKIID
jgi:HlyD family secretion protein